MLKGLRGFCSMNINMVEQNCWDDIPMGPIVDEDFESLLNSLDFPLESLEDDGLGGDWDPSLYQLLGPIPADALMALPPVYDANGCLNAANEFPEAQGTVLFQTQSPISVLEHNSSCSGGKSTSSNFGTKGRRSKRARSSTLNPWILMAPASCTAFAAKKNSDAKKGKEKKRRKLSQQSSVMDSSLFKKCTHCEVTRTPQWREGPLGPKTLCNACGVRYRSGRLLPEYRPAASPTFVPSLHSNSHRKVIEMRRNAVQGDVLETKRSFSNVTEAKICSSEYVFV
ncbi:GATA transcription factor 11 [Nicotiana tabacum]|uniref:GATA transcription factor 11 n=3 Tax=Nicotiana TaxID=4085 RepID=A0A1S4BB31_TOBAC|nr:PREDICTED: GATA transcription factor 11-like [Nicotiana sylvestris]XP_016486021.1 PREDICTED: GATA transcription factor 11-like [Nicotiana tabacum]